MKTGLKDIRHLAIIGAAGAAGVAATLVVLKAVERPHAHHDGATTQVTVIRAPAVSGEGIRFRATRTRFKDGKYHITSSPLVTERVSPVVYIDGIRVNPPVVHAGEQPRSLDDLTPEEIARIDVVKGEKALEFGTEAKERGVILVTTKTGRKKGSGEGSGEGS